MRDVLQIEVAGTKLLGTVHRPDGALGHVAGVGVVILSPGHVARAGAGDLFPQIGDALARLGFPVFRFDFPGLGDSFGSLPELEQDYFRFIQEGGNTNWSRPIIDAARRSYGLRGVILVGLCGGAITAILSAGGEDVHGMVLLDPEFSLIRTRVGPLQGTVPTPAPASSRLARLAHKLSRPKTWIRFATGENRLSRALKPLRSLLLPLTRRLIGERPPSDSNFELIDAFHRVIKRRAPTLVVTASGMVRELYYEQVERVIRSRTKADSLEHVSIANTNHVFTAGGARSTVLDAVSNWTVRHFGSARPQGSPGTDAV